VDEKEGASVWGKGVTSNSDPKPTGPSDAHTGDNPCKGMAVSSVHLMLVSLSIKDEPVGYSPPVGPPVRFTVRYNQRDAFQPANFAYANFGPKWTCDWISYITDNPQSPSADVNYYIMGGGTRTFTGFNALSQTYAFQQYDQTLLIRTSTNSYEMLWPDGSKLVFSQPDASIGSSRKVFLSQVLDPADNAVTLTYDPNFRLVAITDAIGQVTTVAYGLTNDLYKITQVTDPFGRFATFEYTTLKIPITGTTSTTNILALGKITDVIGLSSQFHYEAMPNTNAVLSNSDFIVSLTTPYGTTSFTKSESHSGALYRALETLYPDGSRDRVEFNQSTNTGILVSDPPASVPVGMTTFNAFLYGRNTFYWSRNACASSYGDYSKAKLFHWLHTADLTSTSGILESRKNALEGRVWYDYVGQGGAYLAGTNNKPTHIGRVLDDGTTQLYTYTYDAFGHVTSMVDPLGRAFSFVYATNGIDLLEVRQTRGGNDQLLFRATYNATHLPLTQTDAAGQTTTFTYNARGQLLTRTNPKGEATTNIYNANGYLIMVDGPLPGTNDVIISTYDSFGRTRTKTDGSGYTLTFDYDGMDRISRVTHPDTTFSQYIYDRLDLAMLQDRAGRQTHFEHDPHGQLTRRTDPLGRTTVYQWCRCGAIKSIVDPLGRTTSWLTDVQGRRIGKQYADGSQVTYSFEATTSRLRQVIDEEQQVTQYAYNRDDTLAFVAYSSGAVPTPGVSFTYDPDYSRVSSMTDGTGTTLYSYNPIGAPPALGAGRLASVDGPLPNDTITYAYDELGRPVHRAIDGVDAVMAYDAAGRLVAATNALGGWSRKSYPMARSRNGAMPAIFRTRRCKGSLIDSAPRQFRSFSMLAILRRIASRTGHNRRECSRPLFTHSATTPATSCFRSR
jgi:YD repeat-containing protein